MWDSRLMFEFSERSQDAWLEGHFQDALSASRMAPASPLRRLGHQQFISSSASFAICSIFNTKTTFPSHIHLYPSPIPPSSSFSSSSSRSWSMRRAPGTSWCPAPRDESSEIWKWWSICWCISFDFAGLENLFQCGVSGCLKVGGAPGLEVGGAPGLEVGGAQG